MLTDAQRTLIRATVPVLQAHGEAITAEFYRQLFTDHPELLNIFNKANQREGGQSRSLAASILMYAAHIDHLDQLGSMVERIANKHGSMEVQPEHYPIVGQYLLSAIRSVLEEAATEDIIDAWGAAYGQLAEIFITREKHLYDEGASQPGGWYGYKPFIVRKKIQESATITSFHLYPEDALPLPSFRPGQYLSIKLKPASDPNEQVRQYSVSCAPNGAYYRISVGRELADQQVSDAPHGVVSNFLHDHIMAGDTIAVHMPLGDFVLDETSSRPVVLLSGGTGITPMLSMLHKLNRTSERSVTFIHGTRSRAQHAFGQEVRAVARQNANIRALTFYNEIEEDDIHGEHFDEQGFIDAETLRRHIGTHEAEFYYCGPIPFLRAIETALDTLQIPASQRFSEAFVPDPSFLTTAA